MAEKANDRTNLGYPAPLTRSWEKVGIGGRIPSESLGVIARNTHQHNRRLCLPSSCPSIIKVIIIFVPERPIGRLIH